MKKTIFATMVAMVILFVSSIPVWAAVPVDPSTCGDYDTSITASTAVGKGMAIICRVATPSGEEYIYAPSECLFKKSGNLQLWGCPNASGETFKARREAYLAWKETQPTPFTH